MHKVPARAWLGSVGLHLTALAVLALGTWVLVRARPPQPPPTIAVEGGRPAVARELPPPLETVEVTPPEIDPAELREAELEFEPETRDSPLLHWPVATDWLGDRAAYREPRTARPGMRRVEAAPTEVVEPPDPSKAREPERVAPPPEPAPATPGSARQDPEPDPAACPEPEYPLRALRYGLEGAVVLLAEVDARGRVVRTRVLESSGHGILDRAAQEAVATWRFRPATEDGEAVPGAARVPIRFRIEEP